jgi:hypothetical protein
MEVYNADYSVLTGRKIVYFVVVKVLGIVYWQCVCQAGEDLAIKGVNSENITVNHFAENQIAIVYLIICTHTI